MNIKVNIFLNININELYKGFYKTYIFNICNRENINLK